MLSPLSQTAILASIVEPGVLWTGPKISFSIPTVGSAWPQYATDSYPYLPDYAVLSAGQATSFRQAIQLVSDLIAKPFVETNDVTEPGGIRIAFSKTDPYAGLAYYPPLKDGSSGEPAGDIWLTAKYKGESWGAGDGNLFEVMLHELGHALGLRHVNEGANALPDSTGRLFTVMASNNLDTFTLRFWSDPTIPSGVNYGGERVEIVQPMVYDVLALQTLYGANPNTAAGDNVYTWKETDTYYRTIYDAGGVDTIDLKGHVRGSEIDLRPGAYSSIDAFSKDAQRAYWTELFPASKATIDRVFDDPARAALYEWRNNVGIAYGTVIENVDAGAGDDVITGNDAANVLKGNAGKDIISGGDGNDSIDGGADFDQINGNVGDDTAHGGEGGDWVVGGKDHDLLYGDTGDDVVYGNLGNDTCYGGNGADWVRGGQGDDVIDGGAGNDWMAGDRGNDTVIGGAGADRFYFFAGAATDRVTDFSSAEGDRVLLDAGQAYTLSFTSEGAVIDLGGGDQMILVGVTQASLGDWLAI